MADYDYVMYNKTFHIEEANADQRSIYMSLGGLLMQVSADKQVLIELDIDLRVYLLMVKRDKLKQDTLYD